MPSFADSAIYNLRPGKPHPSTPSFPLVTLEEFSLIGDPYASWAPAPYSHLPHSCFDAMTPILSPENSGAEDSPWVVFPARLRVLRAKLWHGMVPLTRERWVSKKLDDPANYRMVVEILRDILKLFEFYNREDVLGKMRRSYNRVADAYAEFDLVIDAWREAMGVEGKLDVEGMWAEYYSSVVRGMCERAYGWVAARVGEVQGRAFEEYGAALERAGEDLEARGQAGKRYYACVQDLNVCMNHAERDIAISLEGFKGIAPSNAFVDLPAAVRNDTLGRVFGALDWKHSMKMINAQQADTAESKSRKTLSDHLDELKNPKPAPLRFRDSEALLGHCREWTSNRAAIAAATRGPPKQLPEEHWITVLKQRQAFYLANGQLHETWNHRWGFVCYRLTYSASPSQWALFKSAFEADIFRSGDWIEGYETIKERAGIEYVDGRDVGIAEGDIEGAKKHFKATYTAQPSPGRLWTTDFLVIDQQCFESHTAPPLKDIRPPPPYGPCFGDNGGFVRLVDAATEQNSPEYLEEFSPGYTGNMKVLSSLLLEEVYPLLTTGAMRPEGMWPLARLHPGEVYVGHTVGAQEGWWESERILKAGMLKSFFEHMRAKQKEEP